MSSAPRLVQWLSSLADSIVPPGTAYAHCDIPCGIYDPHEAQISALTVLRMDQLIAELAPPAAGAKPEEVAKHTSQLARYALVKEQHAERVKHELRILWGDYFTADHVKQYPELHEMFFKALKAASKGRQGSAVADAQELLKQVQEIAETFWKTKGAKTARVPSHSKAGGELVVPVS
jgi:nickel superoxide dismutase